MPTDWLLRVSDGGNLRRSSKHGIWGIRSMTNGKGFIKHVKPGDRLWFVEGDTGGQSCAVATYHSDNMRVAGLTMSNEELGWNGEGADWDIEVHYTDLYDIKHIKLLTGIVGPATIRKYNEKCKVNLAVEYSNIERYCEVKREL